MNSALLRRVGSGMGLPLSSRQVASFGRYAAELVAWNARLNLTRITGPDRIAIEHVVDSLVCLRGLPDAEGEPHTVRRCVDVGSGAGFPGLPLKLVRPHWRLTLVESVRKKAEFLAHMVAVLGLEDVTVLRDRAEVVGRDPEHRERYDVAVARAVAAGPVLAEYLLPLLRPGGRMLILKGSAAEDEAAALAPALEVLGGRLLEVQPYRLPGLDAARHLVVVEKTARTPDAYPRRAGVPEKRCIGSR